MSAFSSADIHLLSGIFICLFWVQISAPSQSKNEQKLPKIVNNISNSIALQFGKNFMKIGQKIAKLQMFTSTH